MPLGMEVGLGPGHKGGAQQSTVFGPCLLWPNGWMDIKMPLGTELGLGPDDIV